MVGTGDGSRPVRLRPARRLEIATGLAMVKSGTVVTEEKPTGNIAKPRIPDVCDALGVHCLTPKEYIEAQGWTF